jgi:hypothetical protein
MGNSTQEMSKRYNNEDDKAGNEISQKKVCRMMKIAMMAMATMMVAMVMMVLVA